MRDVWHWPPQPNIAIANEEDIWRLTHYPEVGKQTFAKSPQITNPQILGFIPQSQIRKFLWSASQQTIANSQLSTKHCSTLSHSHKNRLCKCFLMYKFELKHYVQFSWGGKICILRTCGSFKSENHKKRLEVRKSQIRKVPRLRKIRKSDQGEEDFSPLTDEKIKEWMF